MTANGPVNVRLYILYAMIPGLDYYATKQLDKKKPTTIISLLFMTGLLIFVGMHMYEMFNDPDLGPEITKAERAEIVYEKYFPKTMYAILVFLAIYLPTITYFVHKWAKEWNAQFQKSNFL